MEDIIAYIIIVFGIFGIFKFIRNIFRKCSRLLNGQSAESSPETRDLAIHYPNGYVSTRTAAHGFAVAAPDEYEAAYQEKRKVMGDSSAHDFVNLLKWEDEMIADYQVFLSGRESAAAKMFINLINTLRLMRGLIERSDGSELFLDDLFNHLLPLLDKLFNNYVFFAQQDPYLVKGVTDGMSKAEEGIEDAMSLLRKKAQYLVDMEVVDMSKDISGLECSHVDRLARKYEN